MNRLYSPHFEETFCKLLQQNPLLWDKNAPEFKNKAKQKHAWTKISEALNFPVDTLEKKYKSMREKYRREVLFEQNGGDGVERTPWPTKKHLEFLEKVIVPRKSRNFYRSFEDGALNELSSSSDAQVIKYDNDIDDSQDPLLEETIAEVYTAETSPFVQQKLTREVSVMKNDIVATSINVNTIPTPANNNYKFQTNDCNNHNAVNNNNVTPGNEIGSFQISRGVKRKESIDADDIVKSFSSIVEKIQDKSSEISEFDSFGRFVGSSLANIGEDLADEATSEIMQVLIKYKKLNRRKVNG